MSPLHLSLQEMETDPALSPAVRRKARRFLKKRLAAQIQAILLRGEQRVAEHRLRHYHEIFGRNRYYVRLALFQAMPSVLLRSLFGIRNGLVTGLLTLRGLLSRRGA